MQTISKPRHQLSKSMVDSQVHFRKSTGTLVYPKLLMQSDRTHYKHQKKSYINYPEADGNLSHHNTSQDKLSADRAFSFLNKQIPKQQRDQGEVRQIKKRTRKTLDNINRMITELKSQGGDSNSKRPPLPSCFQRKSPVCSSFLYFTQLDCIFLISATCFILSS